MCVLSPQIALIQSQWLTDVNALVVEPNEETTKQLSL